MSNTPDIQLGDHTHDFTGRTSVDMGHFHTFTGSTTLQHAAVGGHVHNFATETRVAENHVHIMRGTTGIPVTVMMGHVHQMAGSTEVAENHTHTFDLFTTIQHAPRNYRRRRLIQAQAAGENEEAPPKKRLAFKLKKLAKEAPEDANPSSDEK